MQQKKQCDVGAKPPEILGKQNYAFIQQVTFALCLLVKSINVTTFKF